MQEIIVGLYILSLTALFIFALPTSFLMLYNKLFKKKNFIIKCENNPDKEVTIQLPVFNEFYVVERLIDAVCAIEYPQNLLEIQILDDSTDETKELIDKIAVRKISDGFDIKILRRKKRIGFKGGALREGLKTAKGEFIAIFDADFIPKKDFLKKTISYFTDPLTGVVQTRWEHLNEDFSLLTKIQAAVLDNHFAVDQLQKYKAGLFINFNGTAGVWRKKTILDAGNWQDDTLTEDLDLSYRAQLKGWRFLYLDNIGSPAELPIEINAVKSQQFRWTKGAVETSKKLLPEIWKAHISFRKKIFAIFHLNSNFVFPIIILLSILNLPLLIIKNAGVFSNVFNLMSVFLTVFFLTFIIYFSTQKKFYLDWKRRIKYFPAYLAGTMGLSINNSKAVMEALFNFKSEFIRTPKFRVVEKSTGYFSKKYLTENKFNITTLLEITLALYCTAGVALALYLSDYASLPVQILFAVSFSGVSYFSIRSKGESKIRGKKKYESGIK